MVVQGEEVSRPVKQLLSTKRRKLLLSFLQHENQRPNTGKCLLTRDAQKGNGNAKGGMDRLFIQKYFQLHSNFNAKVNYNVSPGFSGSGLIPIGGIPLFLFDPSKRMLCTP